MSDLATWYLAQLDEDERLAQKLTEPYRWGYNTFWEASPDELEHIDRYDPEHVLADIAAKRRIVELYQSALETTGCGLVGLDGGVFLALDEVVHLLAAALSDRPGYDPAWAPREES